ncbi:MAG: cytochrome oxidase assembly protein [Puniceicoccaceae bacterium]|nr:MAG: cytochrome oxidase assembly protein [Puniceicoccaceae bacterium]
MTHHRTAGYKPSLFWYSLFALLWTTFLLYAGGFTTSIQAGMAFLDWPLSNGSINPAGWTQEQDQLAEHSHRLLGMIVGLLMIGLAVWLHRREPRGWLRLLGRLALLLVILQGLLGGARVLLDELNLTHLEHNRYALTFAVLHACMAQVFLCLLVAVTAALSRSWIERKAGLPRPASANVTRWGWIACAALFLQLLVGALMRHNHAALAIPTFPLTPEGGLIPSLWDFKVAIHFAHRVGAVVVLGAIGAFLWFLLRDPATRRSLAPGAGILAGLLLLQIYLGALVVWTVRNPQSATMHMLVGAFLLATCFALTFLSHRHRFEPSPPSVRRDAAAARRTSDAVPLNA